MRGECETLGAMRLVQRVHVLAALREGEAFACSGLCVGPPRDSLLLADLSNRCVRLFQPSATDDEAARSWTQSAVYAAPSDRRILAIATRRSPPADGGAGGGDELLVVEWLTDKSRPTGWLVRALWSPDARQFVECARAPLASLPPKCESQLMSVGLAAGSRLALVGLAFSRALDVFALDAPVAAGRTCPALGSAPPLALEFRQFCFAIGPPLEEASTADGPQLLAHLCRDDHSLHVMLVRSVQLLFTYVPYLCFLLFSSFLFSTSHSPHCCYSCVMCDHNTNECRRLRLAVEPHGRAAGGDAARAPPASLRLAFALRRRLPAAGRVAQAARGA